MLKNLIISSESSNLYTTKRFLAEAKLLKIKSSWHNPYEKSLYFTNNKEATESGLYLHRTSGIRYDDFDLLVAEFYQQNGYSISNPLRSLKPFREKDSQLIFFKENKINHIPTIVFRGSISLDLKSNLSKLFKDGKYILKMNRGNGGVGVQLINGLDSLYSVLETYQAIKDQKMLIQPYIYHQTEWRLFVTKKGQVEIIKRQLSRQDFRANNNRAAARYIKKPINELVQLALEIINKSQLDYAGIDVIETSDHFLVVEVNSVPGFEQLETLADKNIAREIILL